MRLWLRRLAVTLTVLAVIAGLVVMVIAIRHSREAHERAYKHNIATYCLGHGGIAKFVSPGPTGVYIVCKDGKGGKVEN